MTARKRLTCVDGEGTTRGCRCAANTVSHLIGISALDADVTVGHLDVDLRTGGGLFSRVGSHRTSDCGVAFFTPTFFVICRGILTASPVIVRYGKIGNHDRHSAARGGLAVDFGRGPSVVHLVLAISKIIVTHFWSH